jgi:Ca-activated chloride channel family protein
MMETRFIQTRIWGFVLMGLLFGGGLSGSTARAESARSKNNSGVEAYKQGKMDVAVEQFRQAKAADPENLVLDYNLGVAQAAQGEVEGALQDLGRAALARDAQVAARAAYSEGVLSYQEAQKKLEAKDTQNALKMAERAVLANREALRKNPADADARVNYELARRLQKQLQEQMKNQQNQKDQQDKQDKKDQQKQDKQDQQKQDSQKQDKNDQQQDKQNQQQDKQDQQKQDKNDQKQDQQNQDQQKQDQQNPKQDQQDQKQDKNSQQKDQQGQQQQNQNQQDQQNSQQNTQQNQQKDAQQEQKDTPQPDSKKDAQEQKGSAAKPEQPDKAGEKTPQAAAQEKQGKEGEPQDATLSILNLLSDNDTKALKRALARRQALQVQRPEKDW